ncbi:MAG: gliding motility protein GldN [Bacteroidales bacterium]|nr:gliding motility protein GldN [Bacteroidales bacterium]
MNVNRIYLVIAFWLSSAVCVLAQPTHSSDWEPPTNRAHPYEKVNMQGIRQPVALAAVNESDVMFERIIWRRIELKEKINQKFYYPGAETPERQSLASVLFNSMQQVSVYDDDYDEPTGPNFKGTPFEGAYTLIAYEDDDFTRPYHNIEDIPIFGVRTSLTGITDSLGRQTFDTLRIEPRDVLSYMLKEVWFFDKKRSQWDVRILGICPEYRIKKSIGERPYENYEQNVWFYFPQARYYLCNKVCYNPHNDLEQWTYDDAFMMRMFNSYIVKESNLQNRMVSEYTKGVDAIIESERIKKELIDFESYLWEY